MELETEKYMSHIPHETVSNGFMSTEKSFMSTETHKVWFTQRSSFMFLVLYYASSFKLRQCHNTIASTSESELNVCMIIPSACKHVQELYI